MLLSGGVSRVAKGADCKSAVLRLRRFESFLPHQPSLAKREKAAAPQPEGRRRAIAASYCSASHPRSANRIAARAASARIRTLCTLPAPLDRRTHDGATPPLKRGSLIRKIAPPSR